MSNSTLTTLRMKLPAAVLTTVLSLMPLGVGAAGLGKITVLSALGQTLHAEVDISASREELSSLSARVASTEAFRQAGIEYSSALTTIRFTVNQRADGRPFLSMVSDRPFNEPFLDMLVELNWNSGRLVREYTFLLDPPESQQKLAAPVAAPVSPPMAAPVPPPAAPEARRETMVAAPAPVANQAETRETTPSQEKPSPPRPDMKPPRSADDAQRALKAEPLQPRKESAQRLVKRGDTLSQIAKETKPEGVNLDQMLVALFRGNQEAFEGNVNRLKAGKILAIPDSDSAAGVNADEAKRTVLAHAADFNAYSKKLAAAVATAATPKDEMPKRAVSGKIAPKVEDKMPPATPGKDKLEVSKSELAAGKAGAGRLAAIEETLIAREKALKDANSRIAELEKNLNDLKKLIELKNQGMAELQKQAQVVKPVVPPPPPPPAAEIKKPVAAAKPTEKPADKAAEKPVDKPVEAAKPASPPKPAPAEKKSVPPPPPPAAEPTGFIDESPEIVYGGGGILALLLFYFGYKRYRLRQGSRLAPADASEPASAMSVSGMGAPTVDSDNLLSPNDFSNLSGIGGNDGDAGVDPVAEANVYLAYGRDVQAEEILLDALKTDPTRHAIHLKLLEIYANRKSNKQFETIARDLHNQTGGAGSDWEAAAGLGRQIDPPNPLYGEVPASAKGFDPDATLVIKPEEREIDLGDLATAGSMEDDFLSAPAEAQSADASPEPAAPQEELPVSLDFELDLAEPEPASPTPALAETTMPTVPAESAGIDIDLGLDIETSTSAATPAETSAADLSAQEAMPAVADFDLDLDLGSKEAAATESPTALPSISRQDASEDAASGLDFNFDLDAGEPAVSAPAPEPVADSHSIDFDLDVPVPATPQPAPSVDLSSISLDLGEPLEPKASPGSPEAPSVDDAASQDVETKLELAQAYEEMGDKEGARELLQEVLNEGNAVQKETARGRLERLG